jgi:outer membrane autotransporter protein
MGIKVMKKILTGIATAALLTWSTSGAIASSVSDDTGQSNNLVSTSTSSTASTQGAGLIAGNIGGGGGGFGGGGGGGGGGGFGPGGGGPGGGPGDQSSLNNVEYAHSGIDKKFQYFNLREMQGRSAGGKALRFNAWLNGAITFIEKSDLGGEFEGDVFNIVGGLDYLFTKNFLAGIAVGYESLDIDTSVNNGTFEGDGVTIAGYMGYTTRAKGMGSPYITWDFSAGYTFLDYETTRNNNAVSGNFDANRWYISSNLTATYFLRNTTVRLSPKIGILYLTENQDSFTESTGTAVGKQEINLGRMTLGSELGYRLDVRKPGMNSIEPFAKLYFEYDFDHEDGVNLGNGTTSAVDDYGFVAGGGINFNFTDRFSAKVEGSANAIARENLDVYTVSGKINYRF